MAGGGTGGHVIPALAVARELRRRGHDSIFIGTREGMEAKLVPAGGFPIEWIEIGGLNRVGAARALRTMGQLPMSVIQVRRLIEKHQPAATFSMGGYAAGPVVLAAWLRRLPVVVMEPNAIPGFTNRRFGRFVARALVSFPETASFFPPGRTELTGLPVRSEFFSIPPKQIRESMVTVLITGGSRGSRTLNRAVRESWPLLREANAPVRLIHQTGSESFAEIEREFAACGLEGKVVPFLEDMAAAFAESDIIVSRSGAGAVAEVAAAGKASILVPFPFAADDHQLRNAEAFERAGAARLVLDKDMTGARLLKEVRELTAKAGLLEEMGEAARRFAKPWAAQRAADILEELTATR